MVNIKLAFLGHVPHVINRHKLSTWKSKLFRLDKTIDSLTITTDSDNEDWGYTDQNILSQLPNRTDSDILLFVTNVRLEDNYFVRRFPDNRVCMTFFEMSEILIDQNIPLENLILRVLYSVSFVYRRYNNQLPTMAEMTHFTHDETRGCIFDMNGIKTEIIYSLNKPILCDECSLSLQNNRVGSNLILKVKDEIKGIRKDLYYRLLDWVKKYPICAIVFSSITAIFLGIVGSLIASFYWEKYLRIWFGL